MYDFTNYLFFKRKEDESKITDDKQYEIDHNNTFLVSVKDFKEALGYKPGPHDDLFGIQFSED